jgi:hypothetical protein
MEHVFGLAVPYMIGSFWHVWPMSESKTHRSNNRRCLADPDDGSSFLVTARDESKVLPGCDERPNDEPWTVDRIVILDRDR